MMKFFLYPCQKLKLDKVKFVKLIYLFRFIYCQLANDYAMHSLSIRQSKLQRITTQLWQRTILMQASSSTIPPTRLYSSSILSTAISRYEDFIGLTEVKKAQDAVIAVCYLSININIIIIG
jgi:hypothetical protein